MAVLIDGINSVFVWLRLDQIRNQKSKLEKNFGSNWMKRSRSNSTEKSTWNIWPDEISKEIIHAKSMTEDTKSLFGINSRSKNLCCVLKQSNELSVNAWPFRYPAKKLSKNLEKRFQFSRNSAIYKTGEYSNALTEANILNKKNNLNCTILRTVPWFKQMNLKNRKIRKLQYHFIFFMRIRRDQTMR